MVKTLVVLMAVVAVAAANASAENATESIEGEVVRNSRGIASSLSSLFGGGSNSRNSDSHNSNSHSSSSSDCGDEYEIIQLTPQVGRGLDLNNIAISGHGLSSSSGSYGGSYGGSGSPAVSTRVVGQNVRQTGSGPISSIRQGPTHQVSAGASSYASSSGSVIRGPASSSSSSSSSCQSAPASGCGCGCCCPCGCGNSGSSAGCSCSSSSSSSCGCGSSGGCGSGSNGGCGGGSSSWNQPGQPQIEYVHIEHPPQIIEQVVEHHIEHPPQIIETVVEHVVEHPPQIIEHTNHVIEKVPHVMIARGGGGSHHESHSFSNDVSNVINHAVSSKFNNF